MYLAHFTMHALIRGFCYTKGERSCVVFQYYFECEYNASYVLLSHIVWLEYIAM